jgi:hypothetical protein
MENKKVMEKRFERDFIEKIITESRRKLWVVNRWDYRDSEILLFHNYKSAKNKYDEFVSIFKSIYFRRDTDGIDYMKLAIEKGDIEIVDEPDIKEMRFYNYEDSRMITLYSQNVNN